MANEPPTVEQLLERGETTRAHMLIEDMCHNNDLSLEFALGMIMALKLTLMHPEYAMALARELGKIDASPESYQWIRKFPEYHPIDGWEDT